MDKRGFERRLRFYLLFLSASERDEAVNYYMEIIDDKIDSGMSEEQAIEDLGSIYGLAKAIMLDGSPARAKKPSNRRTWVVALLASTAIIWAPIVFALLCAAFAVAVTFAAVGVSFAIATGAMLIYIIPNAVIGIITGVAAWKIILSTGAILFCSGVLGFIATAEYLATKYCLKAFKYVIPRKKR